jgi:hypothetical protein
MCQLVCQWASCWAFALEREFPIELGAAMAGFRFNQSGQEGVPLSGGGDRRIVKVLVVG